MATKAQRKKQILAKKAACQDKEVSKLESYIDLGEVLIAAQDDKNAVGDSLYVKDGGFDAWCEKICGVKKMQQSRLRRVAKHKEQVRHIARTSGTTALDDLQKLIPGYKEDPILIESDTPVDAKPARNKNDWHTPAKYIESARRVMGSIDCDPFTSVQANERVQAAQYFTVADSGMDNDWQGPNVWMNPPYTPKKSEGVTALCAASKLFEQYRMGNVKQAVVLMNLAMDTEWFAVLFSMASVICFTDHRIQFEDAGGKKQSGNTKSQMFFYIGPDPDKFAAEFKQYGPVMARHAIAIQQEQAA